jgi:hypothetical protein
MARRQDPDAFINRARRREVHADAPRASPRSDTHEPRYGRTIPYSWTRIDCRVLFRGFARFSKMTCPFRKSYPDVLVRAAYFAVCDGKFPVRYAGNSCKQTSLFKGASSSLDLLYPSQSIARSRLSPLRIGGHPVFVPKPSGAGAKVDYFR